MPERLASVRSRRLLCSSLVAALAAGCSSNVDIRLPFVGVDQDVPVAHGFVSHKASAEVTVDGTAKVISRYEWRVRDPAGNDVPVNAFADRCEWIPLKEGRFEVSVKMTYDNETPGNASDDKTVTETRDVVVLVGAPQLQAIWDAAGVRLRLPLSTAPLGRTWYVTHQSAGGASTVDVLPLALPVDPVLPLPTELRQLAYTATVLDGDGAPFYSMTVLALPRLVSFELWSGGPALDGGSSVTVDGGILDGGDALATRLEPVSCARRRWGFPMLQAGPRSHLELRNTSSLGVAYQFREAWASTTYAPGADQNTGLAYVSGVLPPGGIVDITRFQLGVMGLVGAIRPFSDGGTVVDEGTIPWTAGELSWIEAGAAVTYPAETLYVAQVTWSDCGDPDSQQFWK
jgi:hypothetical protein